MMTFATARLCARSLSYRERWLSNISNSVIFPNENLDRLQIFMLLYESTAIWEPSYNWDGLTLGAVAWMANCQSKELESLSRYI